MEESDDLKRLLEENLHLAKDNNRMLRAIRREAWIGLIVRIVFWTGLIVIPAYFLGQYLSPIFSQLAPGTATSTSSGFFGIPSPEAIKSMLQQYQQQGAGAGH